MDSLQNILKPLQKVFSAIGDFLSGFWDRLSSFFIGLFVPSDDFFPDLVDDFKLKLNELFGFSDVDFGDIVGASRSFEDFKVSFSILGVRFSDIIILDMGYVDRAVSAFRGILRAMLYFWLLLYNINHFLALIGQAPLTFGRRIADVSASEQKG